MEFRRNRLILRSITSKFDQIEKLKWLMAYRLGTVFKRKEKSNKTAQGIVMELSWMDTAW